MFPMLTKTTLGIVHIIGIDVFWINDTGKSFEKRKKKRKKKKKKKNFLDHFSNKYISIHSEVNFFFPPITCVGVAM